MFIVCRALAEARPEGLQDHVVEADELGVVLGLRKRRRYGEILTDISMGEILIDIDMGEILIDIGTRHEVGHEIGHHDGTLAVPVPPHREVLYVVKVVIIGPHCEVLYVSRLTLVSSSQVLTHLLLRDISRLKKTQIVLKL